jgi:flagellar basal-body rod protein FlgC
MSLFSIFATTSSSMNAQTVRLNTIASNLANADVVASTPEEAYKSKQVVFSEILKDQGLGQRVSSGVRVSGIGVSHRENSAIYQPGHPLANDKGYVFASNVDSIEEMANMLSASRSYQSSVDILNTSKKLMQQTIRLGQ